MQLAAAVNSTEELWTLDTLPTTQYVSVGSETVEVRASFPSQIFSLTGQATAPQIRVKRGVGGTTAASHLINAALTPVYGLGGGAGGGGVTVTDGTTTVNDVTELSVLGGTVTDEGAGVAGVAVTTRMLGPFRLNWNTVNIATGVIVAELDAGSFIMDAWAIVRVMWDSTAPVVKVRLHESSASSGLTLGTYALDDDQYDVGAGRARAAPTPEGFALPVIGFAESACVLNALVISDSGVPSAGALDIYALLAIPPA